MIDSLEGQRRAAAANVQRLRRDFLTLISKPTREVQQVRAILDRMLDARAAVRRVTPNDAEFARRVESIDRVIARCRRMLTLRDKGAEALELRFELADATKPPAARLRLAARLTALQEEIDTLLDQEEGAA